MSPQFIFISKKKSALDPDAEAFLLAAGITDATITSAIDTLVKSLKADSIWAKMIALYPFVGGTASTHKFNLKDPRDLDAAFRLTFVGSPTHDANGLQGNGSSQYADTNLNTSLVLSNTDVGVSYYTRTNESSGGHHGNIVSSSNCFYVLERFTTDSGFGFIGNETNSLSFSNTDARGFYTFNRTAADFRRAYKNGNTVATNTGNNASELPNLTFLILAVRLPSIVTAYMNRQISFFSIHTGLTDTEASNLNSINLAFQTALSRNV